MSINSTQKPIDILFINPPSAFGAYENTKVSVFRQVFPLLSFMSLGGRLKQEGLKADILDLGIEKEPWGILRKTLEAAKPRFIGITSTTPLFFEVKDIAKIAREILGNEVKIIYGGPHATALPKESLEETEINIAVVSEGEETLKEILEGKNLSAIKGIFYKDGGKILSTSARGFIKNLDSLPMPDISLYDIRRYHCSGLVSRGTPVLHMETSRGCPSNCSFCNKNIFQRFFRTKSAERVVDEMKYFIKHGVGEFRIIDDQFATDIERAKKICKLMIKENIRVPWNLANGVRVDRVDQEFLDLAKKAGCYQVGIGFESGDQKSLDSIDKGITLEQAAKCMEMVKKAGLESVGFFMLGLPADTEESLKKTIDFAVKMMPTYAKCTVTLPLPGTRMFDQYEKEGRIKTRDWSQYNFHKVGDVYKHPNLSAETLKRYYNLFYRRFYFNPRYLKMRIIKSIRDKTFLRDVYYGLKTFLPDFFSFLKLGK
ncbi:MAG: hypothetical protein A3A10_02615 [Candidatus Tagabacteria bacterium RIFCSPLOWO2_01_FULL_42_9]|uniref:Uncharacterized protein n=1 Tax=Candidatus Tagabacteria bacterium RIFCSPLOWO2_01_FULL_42_9 TaxID=1802296 RepID=A0A1G2LSA2_9BACT|nr:MAG: hypothetical protein A3A10_02615 [Candidatus Tagabacteria bacterium RIFCSPLOWO2_01_FULL_42_9]